MKTIEFLGMPKAGKTTAIEIAESYLKQNGKIVRTVYEGARISPLDKEDRFMYNSWSFHNTVNRILEAKLNDYDVILVDRGIFDHIAFWRAICKYGERVDSCGVEEYFSNFLKLEDQAIVFTLSPEEAIKRERKNNPYLGRVFNKAFLKRLESAYEMISACNDLIKIDGSNSLEENSERMLDIIKNLNNQVSNGKKKERIKC